MSEQDLLQSISKASAFTLQERIDGTRFSRAVAEFLRTSTLFPILDAIRVITTEGWGSYLTETSHYVLLLTAFIQAWFLGVSRTDSWRIQFFGNILGFGLYLCADLLIEGWDFFNEPYHWLFGGFSLLIAALSAMQTLTRSLAMWHTMVILLLNISKTALLPAMYFISDQNIDELSRLTWTAWHTFAATGEHRFLLDSTLLFGALLGLAEAQRIRHAEFLHRLTAEFKRYSEWSLSPDLVADSIDDPSVLQLHRTTKTILFMDVRGFTAWSEKKDPGVVVDMLNEYYRIAENTIHLHDGHKPCFIADEVMSRFEVPQNAFDAALALQKALQPMLETHGLAVGIGVNTGEVIEGLMGSHRTRKYDIIGDAVNTAKRLESAAGKGDIVLAMATFDRLVRKPDHATARAIQVKGKSDDVQVMILHHTEIPG